MKAALVYFYQEDIVEFFQSVHQPTNDLHRPVLSALISGNYMVTLRAWGLVGHFIAIPWLAVVEDLQLTILDLNHHYAAAYDTLKKMEGEQHRHSERNRIVCFPKLSSERRSSGESPDNIHSQRPRHCFSLLRNVQQAADSYGASTV